MKTFSPFFFLTMCVILLSGPARLEAQVLSLDKKEGDQETQKIELQGLVAEQKKYSFTMQDGETTYSIKLPRGIPVFMNLVKPQFDFVEGSVAVEAKKYPVDRTDKTADDKKTADDEQAKIQDDPDQEAGRVRMPLPNPVFVVTQFAHQQQRERVLSKEVLRLNNYTLQPGNPGINDQKSLQFAGKIVTQADKTVLQFDGTEKPVMLGFRNAKLTGLSIATLNKDHFYLRVEGQLQRDGTTIVASQVEVIPRR